MANTVEKSRLFDGPDETPRLSRAVAQAQHILQLAGVNAPPVDIYKVARLLSVRRIDTIRFQRAQACLLPTRQGHSVLLEEQSDPRRRRYSLAHELGHLIQRASRIRFRNYYNRKRALKEEMLSDEIAAELLIPQDLGEPRINDGLPDIELVQAIADEFESPLDTAAIRLGELSRELVQVVIWEAHGHLLLAKRTSGEAFIRPGAQRQLTDMTRGPVQAYFSNEAVPSYEPTRRWHSGLTLKCESMKFQEPGHEYVVSILQQASD